MSDHIDIVMKDIGQGPTLEFIEIQVGEKSIRVGKFVDRGDGTWALRITKDEFDKLQVPV